MKLIFKIAARYLVSKKSTNTINIISGVAVAGITVGTMALIIVLSVFNGFENLVLSLYQNFYPDIHISAKEGKSFIHYEEKFEQLQNIEGIHVISMVVEENVLLRYGEKQYIATIKGVDDNYHHVTGVDENIIYGEYLLQDEQQSYAVIGLGIDVALDVNIDNPFTMLSIYVPKKGRRAVLTPEEAFNRELIKPAGVFAIQTDFDTRYLFVPIDFAKSLLEYDREITAYEVSVHSSHSVKNVIKNIQELMGNDFEIKDRYRQHEFLYKVMKIERLVVFAILSFILAIASFNIVGSLSMLVIEKSKDIGILKTLGADSRMIRLLFLTEGMMLALTGTTAGFIIAIIICTVQQQFGIIKLHGSGSFVVDAYPVVMQAGEFVLVLLIVTVITLAASWFPANKAATQRWVIREE